MRKVQIGSIVKVTRKDHKLYGYVGNVTRILDVSGTPYCVIALDKGYQDAAVLYPCIKYSTVLPCTYVEVQGDNISRTLVRRSCAECGGNCFSNANAFSGLVSIAYEVGGVVVCEKCSKKYYVDCDAGTLKRERPSRRKEQRENLVEESA